VSRPILVARLCVPTGTVVSSNTYATGEQSGPLMTRHHHRLSRPGGGRMVDDVGA
jgi:hypothetical protein